MSKRRRKKQPNLPKATLERARRQAGLEESELEGDSEETVSSAEDEQSSAESVPARRRKLTPAQLDRNARRGDLDAESIQELLESPTVFVSEEQLRDEYQHVLLDLRNMGILAAALMVLLVVLAQFI